MSQRKKKAAANPNNICFVIMPFGGWFDNYYNNIYYPAIVKSGLTPRRADDLYRPSSIIQDIWAFTKTAKIIVADLTDKNPNVFYELGLAHALAKPAILVTHSIEDVPFDLRNLRIIEYNKNEPNWGDNLLEKIVSAIRETMASPNETIPLAFLDTKSISKPYVTEEDKAVIQMKQDIEFLKNELLSMSRKNTDNSSESETQETVSPYGALLKPSLELSKIVGTKPLPRTEIIKRIWDYIKRNGLQDKKNRRVINADAKLIGIFDGKKQVSMFELAKTVSKHVR